MMNHKNIARLNFELMRVCRVIDHAENNKTAWDFIEARNAVMGLKLTFAELIAAELAAQLVGMFVQDLPELQDKKTVPVSEQ